MSLFPERIPPQSIEAEQSILGAMMLDREAVFKVEQIIRPEDFYREAHSEIFRVIADLVDRTEPVDIITVTEELRQRDALDRVGGITYITSLVNAVPTAANVEAYARIVADKAMLRQLIGVTTRIASRGYEATEEAHDLVDEAERMIMELSQRRVSHGLSAIKDILIDAFEKLEHLLSYRGSITGVPTDFLDLDRLTSGWQASDLVILASRPSMGKTSLGLNFAINAAVRHKVTVAVFSLEMSKEQLIQRMLSSEAMVNQQRLRTGNLQEEDWTRLVAAAGPLSEASIFIDDTPGITVTEIRSQVRRLKAEHGLGLIVIDYLQLMQGHKRSDTRQQEIAQISRALKGLAREMVVPVIALSQLNRGVEQRQDKRPMMSDLFESGAIEADADVVSFIYRDDYYNPDSEKKGIAEIIISKHRNGPVGTVELGFLKEFTRFVNLSREKEG
jgi:replicative DNA helicase